MEIEWKFNETQLKAIAQLWVSEQVDNGHPKAIRNAQFVAQQMIKMLKDAKPLQADSDIDINSLPLDLDNFKIILGEDWKDIK